jgi:hypothetical protein
MREHTLSRIFVLTYLVVWLFAFAALIYMIPRVSWIVSLAVSALLTLLAPDLSTILKTFRSVPEGSDGERK